MPFKEALLHYIQIFATFHLLLTNFFNHVEYKKRSHNLPDDRSKTYGFKSNETQLSF